MKRDQLVAAIAMVLIVLASMLRPGDAQMLDDEPNLLQRAFVANSTPGHLPGITLPFSLASRGLTGSRHVAYGPAAVWAYQLLLVFTHDPVMMVAVRALLVNGATAAALFWLARTMGVSVWLAVVTMLSPWLWFFSRQLWDNSFCIPLSAVAVAAYGDFLKAKRSWLWALMLAVACAIAAVLIHLMALALIVPLAAHALIFESRQLWRAKWHLATLFIISVGMAWPYLHYAVGAHSTVSKNASTWQGLVYPFQGGHFLSAAGMDGALGPGWFYRTGMMAYVLTAAQMISLAAYVAVWMGMLLALPKAISAIVLRGEASPLDHLALMSLGVVVCQCALDAYMAIYEHSHYYNATWIVYAIFAWLTVDAGLKRFWNRSVLAKVAMPIYAAALLTIIIGMSLMIARDGGSRDLVYGSSLSEQISAWRRLEQFSSDSPRTILIEQWQKYPGVLKLFPELNPIPSRANLPKRNLIVRFSDQFPGDAHIAVEDRPL